jgi:hypothetical protein
MRSPFSHPPDPPVTVAADSAAIAGALLGLGQAFFPNIAVGQDPATSWSIMTNRSSRENLRLVADGAPRSTLLPPPPDGDPLLARSGILPAMYARSFEEDEWLDADLLEEDPVTIPLPGLDRDTDLHALFAGDTDPPPALDRDTDRPGPITLRSAVA